MTRLAGCGPNLSAAAQNKGNLHIHAAECADLRHYGGGKKFSGEEPWIVDIETADDLNELLYGDFASDEGITAAEYVATYGTDDWRAPCVKL